MRKRTYQNDVEPPVPLHSRLERIDRQLSILRNLHKMAVLLENLDRELLVDKVVLSNEDVEGYVVFCDDGCHGVRL